MSALIPPKHDLRGGNASDDSFAISKNVFVTSMSRCLFAAGNQWVWVCGDCQATTVHELGPVPVELVVKRRFRMKPDMVLALSKKCSSSFLEGWRA